MAVKDGLPATDFSRMNREYIRNVAEGETVKDGLPATDFSRMNREYIKAVVEEAGGGVTVEALTVTENGEYSEEGKAYSPVIVNVPAPPSDFSEAEVTITNSSTDGYILFPCIGAEYDDVMEDWNTMEIITVEPNTEGQKVKIPVYKDGTYVNVEGHPPYTILVTGSITENLGTITVTGDGTITLSDST